MYGFTTELLNRNDFTSIDVSKISSLLRETLSSYTVLLIDVSEHVVLLHTCLAAGIISMPFTVWMIILYTQVFCTMHNLVLMD